MCFKTISIVPGPKHSPPTYLNNCHPVELVPIVMKFFEQLLMAKLKRCLLPSDLQLSWVPWTAGVSWVLPSLPLALGRVALLHYYPIFLSPYFYYYPTFQVPSWFWVISPSILSLWCFHVCVLLWCLWHSCPLWSPCDLSVSFHSFLICPSYFVMPWFQVYEMMLLQVFMFPMLGFYVHVQLALC